MQDILGTAYYYYKMEQRRKDLVFTNNVQSATNEYEDTSKTHLQSRTSNNGQDYATINKSAGKDKLNPPNLYKFLLSVLEMTIQMEN